MTDRRGNAFRDNDSSRPSTPPSGLRFTVRDVALIGVMLTLSGGLAFLVLADPLAAQEGARSEKTATPCSAGHGSESGSEPIDLGRLEMEYGRVEHRFAEQMAQAIQARSGQKTRPTLLRHDASLPACKGRRTRSATFATPLPRSLHQKKLWFFDATPGTRIRLPTVVRDDPAALLLALRAPDLRLLPKLKERLGRDISLAPRRLAEAFGVRCMNTLVEISPDGKEAICHEAR